MPKYFTEELNVDFLKSVCTAKLWELNGIGNN